MKRFEKKIPRVIALHDRVAKRPRIAAYLASKRRIPFSQWGIWRYYKPLDARRSACRRATTVAGWITSR